MLSNVKLTILTENRANNPNLIGEQGLSILVETDHGNLLFDTGQSDAFLKNAMEMGIDLVSVDKIVISHGHYDHTGGLPQMVDMREHTQIYCHPAAINKKYAVYPAGRLDIGVTWEKNDLASRGAHFIYKTHAVEIYPDVWISGEIPRYTEYEFIDEKYQQRVLESFIHDDIHDDMGLYLNTKRGVIVLLGCGHAGVINTVKHAMRVTDNHTLYAVVGGMHLQHSQEERIDKVVRNLEKLHPAHVLPMHCTGFYAIHRMLQCCKDKVKLLNVGDVFEL
ncbi:MAG: MBL fold metallo-hydrolase [Caldithrix sp.]|nr:MBL fold metallo-hydrolase [Caldithrix sp.]